MIVTSVWKPQSVEIYMDAAEAEMFVKEIGQQTNVVTDGVLWRLYDRLRLELDKTVEGVRGAND